MFTLVFRDGSTAELDFSINAAELEAALEATPWCVRPLVQPARASFRVDGGASANGRRACVHLTKMQQSNSEYFAVRVVSDTTGTSVLCFVFFAHGIVQVPKD